MSSREPIPTPATRRRYGGMTGFYLVWIGQMVSLLGTSMSRFALILWAWQVTGQATTLTLMALATLGPAVLLNPVAGVLVDRWSRKRVMILSDCAAGLITMGLLMLLLTGHLTIACIYFAAVFYGISEVFQFPATTAAITLMVPERHYARASGMLSVALSASHIVGPLLAATLIAYIQISGVLMLDIVSFLFAVSMLLWVAVPQPAAAPEDAAAPASLWHESFFGLRYILKHRNLLSLQVLFFIYNLISVFAFVLMSPLILARSGNDELLLGAVFAALGVGGVAGGLLLSLTGGPRRRIHGVLLGLFAESVGVFLFGLGDSLAVWAAAAFLRAISIPLTTGCNQAIWQTKVPPAIQGRVFSARRLIAHVSVPLAVLFAGPCADLIFEPAMQPGAALAVTFGWLVGTGPGAGMRLIFVASGILGAVVAVGGYLVRPIRDVEILSPDHGEAPAD